MPAEHLPEARDRRFLPGGDVGGDDQREQEHLEGVEVCGRRLAKHQAGERDAVDRPRDRSGEVLRRDQAGSGPSVRRTSTSISSMRCELNSAQRTRSTGLLRLAV
jgi:hypothetical protein